MHGSCFRSHVKLFDDGVILFCPQAGLTVDFRERMVQAFGFRLVHDPSFCMGGTAVRFLAIHALIMEANYMVMAYSAGVGIIKSRILGLADFWFKHSLCSMGFLTTWWLGISFIYYCSLLNAFLLVVPFHVGVSVWWHDYPIVWRHSSFVWIFCMASSCAQQLGCSWLELFCSWHRSLLLRVSLFLGPLAADVSSSSRLAA
ncbi:hypothetical protein D5086_017404 [Populus alba]|uniref:Uncharacterized protein n=1 Tax=Populus alba TaxID=43335 RepID=A0ACC4BY36_POPAL